MGVRYSFYSRIYRCKWIQINSQSFKDSTKRYTVSFINDHDLNKWLSKIISNVTTTMQIIFQSLKKQRVYLSGVLLINTLTRSIYIIHRYVNVIRDCRNYIIYIVML